MESGSWRGSCKPKLRRRTSSAITRSVNRVMTNPPPSCGGFSPVAFVQILKCKCLAQPICNSSFSGSQGALYFSVLESPAPLPGGTLNLVEDPGLCRPDNQLLTASNTCRKMITKEQGPGRLCEAQLRLVSPLNSHHPKPSIKHLLRSIHPRGFSQICRTQTMDPLSVTASVVGLLAAGTKVAGLLQSVRSSYQGSQSLATTALQEIKHLTAIFNQIQRYIEGQAAISRDRADLIQLNDLVAILTDCVMTYSELASILEGLNIGRESNVGETFRTRDRLKLVREEQSIQSLIQRLQNQKGSLQLILQLIEW